MASGIGYDRAPEISLTDVILRRMRKGRISDHKARVDALDFTPDGRFLLSCGNNFEEPTHLARDHGAKQGQQRPKSGSRLIVWDCASGEGLRNHELREGCVSSTVRFVPFREFHMVAVSPEQDRLIRIPLATNGRFPPSPREIHDEGDFSQQKAWAQGWRVEQSKPLSEGADRPGRSSSNERMGSLVVSPQGNLICTATESRAEKSPGSAANAATTRGIKFWDPRLDRPVVGHLSAPDGGTPALAFDPTGMVFAMVQFSALEGQLLRLFNTRKLEQGPFLAIFVESQALTAPYQICFSPDGKYILMAAMEEDKDADVPVLRLCCGNTGALLKRVSIQLPSTVTEEVNCEVGFTADSNFFYSGAADCTIRFWAADDSPKTDPCAVLTGHALAPKCVKWNPRYAMMASACQNLVFWVPDKNDQPSVLREVI